MAHTVIKLPTNQTSAAVLETTPIEQTTVSHVMHSALDLRPEQNPLESNKANSSVTLWAQLF